MRSLSRIQSPSVLVVDDDVMLARVLRQVLERHGLRVVEAHSYSEATHSAVRCRVGVFDIELGDGSGVNLAEHMLSTGQVCRFVFFTGGADPAELERAEGLGEVFRKGDGPGPLIDAVVGLMAATTPASAANG